jgi:threonine dehydrogenase-like Zn-dependent dehydrogenase
MLETDRAHVLREMAYLCRPAGTLSIPGVYGGIVDKFPIGMIMNKGLTIRTGQTHVNRWTDDLLRLDSKKVRSTPRCDHPTGAARERAGDVQALP